MKPAYVFHDFARADLRGRDFRGAGFVACDLRGANLEGAQLEGADLGGCRRLFGDPPIPGWLVVESEQGLDWGYLWREP